MRVTDILYRLNVRKKAKKESFEDEKWKEETIEIECVNKNQNRKQAGDSSTTEENKIQKENTDQEIDNVVKAPINISFNLVLK